MQTPKSGASIPEYEWNVGAFLNRTTVVYGPSMSGKTQCLKTIMKILKPHIDQILIFSPTNSQNHSFDGFVDPTLIHDRIYLEDPNGKKSDNSPLNCAVRHLELIWERQVMLSDVYQQTTKIETLDALYHRLPGDARTKIKKYVEESNKSKEGIITVIKHQYQYEPTLRSQMIENIEDKFKNLIIQIYVKYIKDNYKSLIKINDLNENEKYALTYISINPKIMIIFDDCAADYEQLFKKDIMKRYFYNNRHNNVTVLISCQGDRDIPPALRKNTFISIYTDEVTCTNGFNDPSNKYSKDIKKYVQEASATIFSQQHRKLVYIRDDPTKQKFYWIKAEYPIKMFRFGSNALHELCNIVRNDKKQVDKTNTFYEHFKV